MAVNHADLTLFASVLLYPVAAAHVAFGAGARWTTPLFFLAGLAIGVFIVIASRSVLYAAMGRVLRSKMMRDDDGWVAWITGIPLMIVYFAFPIVVTCAGIYITCRSAVWCC